MLSFLASFVPVIVKKTQKASFLVGVFFFKPLNVRLKNKIETTFCFWGEGWTDSWLACDF